MLGNIPLLRKPPVEAARIAVETLVVAVCLIILGFFLTHVPLLSPARTDFVRRKKGRIMIVSSITAAAPNPTIAVYAASKSYLTRYVRCQFYPCGYCTCTDSTSRSLFSDGLFASLILVGSSSSSLVFSSTALRYITLGLGFGFGVFSTALVASAWLYCSLPDIAWARSLWVAP